MAAANGWLRRLSVVVGVLLVAAGAILYGNWIETSTHVKTPAEPMPEPVSVAPPALPALSLPAPLPPAPSSSSSSSAPAVIKDEALSRGSQPASQPDALLGEPDIAQLRARALVLPVQGIDSARLSDTYTQARAAGLPHEALDIMAQRGTPVLAVEDGEVVKLFFSQSGGITLYQFDPDRRYAYYYAHLDRYAEGVREGNKLRKGQVLGYVGSTGNALPGSPHLHFAIFTLGPERQWWRGTPLNPFLVWRDAKP